MSSTAQKLAFVRVWGHSNSFEVFINLSNKKLTYVVYQCGVAFDDPGGIKDIELAICK